MAELVNSLIERMLDSHQYALYLFLFVSAVVENLFPPIPGDTITALGAFLVGRGRLDFTAVFALTTLGSVMGFMLLYYFGRFLGREHFMNRDYRHLSAASIAEAERRFARFGHYAVLANRFLPGIRSVISLVSGISRIPPLKVFLYALASAALWNYLWIQAGYSLGNNWATVRERAGLLFARYNIAAFSVMGAALLAWLVYRLWARRKKKPSAD
ncbi:MAG TPA: DedA family protein [Spirochaetota bacterium]|nr:DedA family protein [Spirochaetota bacterium]